MNKIENRNSITHLYYEYLTLLVQELFIFSKKKNFLHILLIKCY